MERGARYTKPIHGLSNAHTSFEPPSERSPSLRGPLNWALAILKRAHPRMKEANFRSFTGPLTTGKACIIVELKHELLRHSQVRIENGPLGSEREWNFTPFHPPGCATGRVRGNAGRLSGIAPRAERCEHTLTEARQLRHKRHLLHNQHTNVYDGWNCLINDWMMH